MAEVFLENCRISKEDLLGAEGQGGKIALATLDCGRLGIAAQAIEFCAAARCQRLSGPP